MATIPIRPHRKRRQKRRQYDVLDHIQRLLERLAELLSPLELIALRIAVTIIFFVWIYRHVYQEFTK